MTRSARQLRVEALHHLLNGRIVPLIRARDWELLAEVVRLARTDVPAELAATDPALFGSWRAAVTRWHLKGWGRLDEARIAELRAAAEAASPSDPD